MTALRDLAGKTMFDDWEGRELKPYKTGYSTSAMIRLLTLEFPFEYRDGYRGSLTLGWRPPSATTVKGGLRNKVSWQPSFGHSLSRPTDGRCTETHHEWNRAITDADTPEGNALMERYAVVFNPCHSLDNSRYVYRITDGLISRYQDYLESYLRRPETIERIKQLWELDYDE